ncbi:MAG: hypothetical protein JXA46_09555 [Dehalococcoidales bacterium]|nr:hypothetical protein [Dehalococcoidales bacterium]
MPLPASELPFFIPCFIHHLLLTAIVPPERLPNPIQMMPARFNSPWMTSAGMVLVNVG